jgi:hypothetical protein
VTSETCTECQFLIAGLTLCVALRIVFPTTWPEVKLKLQFVQYYYYENRIAFFLVLTRIVGRLGGGVILQDRTHSSLVQPLSHSLLLYLCLPPHCLKMKIYSLGKFGVQIIKYVDFINLLSKITMSVSLLTI